MAILKKLNMTKTIFVLLLICCMMFTLSGCGSDAQVNEETSAEADEGSEYPEIDESIECASVVELTINPAFRFYLDEEQSVVRVESLNDDAVAVCESLDLEGITFDEAFTEILEEAVTEGYLVDGKTVNVEVVRNSNDVYAPDIVQHSVEIISDVCEAHDLKCDYSVTMSEEIIEEQSDTWNEEDFEAYFNSDGSDTENGTDSSASEDENDNTCDLCMGECTITCDLCNGTGTMIETEEREVEVRNGYVCPYCGGAGILDDGMHGGETAVCGYCGGDGATGPMSGEFRELAYDIETVVEEVEKVCVRCNGAGIIDCPHCEGTGVIK